MKYSIVVPVYNVEAYLEDCITSVLEQTCQDYELILVDDGSSDGSGLICGRYARQYPQQIRAYQQNNGGALAARQYGITHASGDIILFLDADDCLRRDALHRIDEVFLREDCDMVLFNASSEPDYSKPYFPHPFAGGTCFEGPSKAELYEFMTVSSTLNSLCIKAVKRQLTGNLPDRAGMPRVVNGEDLLCSLPLVTAAERISYLKQNLYYYRQRPGSAVHSFNPDRADSLKTVHREFTRFIDTWKMPRLHPMHFAREVRGWIETLEMLLANRNQMSREDFRSQLRQLSEDPYFRTAWERMDASRLSPKTRFLAKCLYERQYTAVLLLGHMLEWARVLRNGIH